MEALIQKLRKWLKNNKEVIDVILFGSFVKNKIKPNDIDIALLMNEKKNEVRADLKKIIPNADITLLSLEDYSHVIFLTLIKEGYSIKEDNYLHNIYRTKPVKIYRYNLKQLTSSKKVMFERALKNIKDIERLSNRVILVPLERSGEFEDFLKHWEMDIDTKSYELLPLLRKEEIF